MTQCSTRQVSDGLRKLQTRPTGSSSDPYEPPDDGSSHGSPRGLVTRPTHQPTKLSKLLNCTANDWFSQALSPGCPASPTALRRHLRKPRVPASKTTRCCIKRIPVCLSSSMSLSAWSSGEPVTSISVRVRFRGGPSRRLNPRLSRGGPQVPGSPRKSGLAP